MKQYQGLARRQSRGDHCRLTLNCSVDQGADCSQSGLYPNPTVGYQGEEIRGGSFRGGEHGFFVQQNIVTAGKLGLNRNIFEQERKQAETEADEQKLRVVTNVKMSYIQALGAQQTLELRRNLSKLAQDAVETSHQLANVGQADAPDVLEAEVEGQQADLAVTMAKQNQLRVWKELAAVVGNTKLTLLHLEGRLEDMPALDAADLVEKIVADSPAVKIAELGVKKAEASLARAKREPVADYQADDKDRPHYYARHTVMKAQAEISRQGLAKESPEESSNSTKEIGVEH